MRPAAQRACLLLGAIAVATALVLLFVGPEFGPEFLSPGKSDQQPTATVGPAGSGSANLLTLSVFDQPRPVPEIGFQDDQGHDLTLADFRGRVVLLNLWATWCVPCRKEMPTLDRLQARLGGKDFVVIALSIDRKGIEAVRGFYHEVGVKKLGIYLDPSGKGSHDLAIPGLPATLLIDREGREVARKLGEAEWDSPEMVSLVQRTMHGRSAGKVGEAR
jgi:thiol-disulfide isomerase/thioredoxin